MMQTVASILWCRLDLEGHDACLLSESGSGRNLRGHALFVQDGKPCSIAYEVDCDAGWHTRSARADGFLGTQELHCQIELLAGGQWTLNGKRQVEVDGLIDVDLGFTPATNLLALRRFALDVGTATPAPTAYLTFPELRLVRQNRPISASMRHTTPMPPRCSATMRCWRSRRLASSSTIRACGEAQHSWAEASSICQEVAQARCCARVSPRRQRQHALRNRDHLAKEAAH
ncbi:putative glycolipid-binding domain-containing protein [Mesorhizobium sp. M0060]|uniref:putative glycolipid-binding domain-containing protein n=1 Tax=Mesorhizobium sp. M0060 TaxID=2956866 RepID=UPI0033350A6B